MPARSRFSAPRTEQVPSSKKIPMEVVHDFRGLDLTSPYDLIEKGRTPFAKNFRLYAEDNDSRRIVVSTRKGQGVYSDYFNEAANVSNTSTTGAADQNVGVILNWRAMPFTVSSTGRLSKVELNIKRGTGTGPIIVEIHEDNAGSIGNQIAESSILSGSVSDTYAYLAATFVEAPTVTNGSTYWIVAHIQDDGDGYYNWSSNTASTLSKVSNASIPGMQATTYSLNYKTYISPNMVEKGMFRFAQISGVNRSVVVYDTTMYYVDDSDGSFVPIVTGLSSSAQDYYFTTGDGKLFWVNGYDDLRAWNGTTVATNPELVTNPGFEVNTAGWTATGGGTGNAIARNTVEFHTGVASLAITATSGTRSAQYAMTIEKGKQYRIGYWAKGASGTSQITFPVTPQTSTPVAMDGTWKYIEATITPTVADTAFRIQGTADIFIDDVTVKATGVETIINANLPILKYVTMHKDRLWGVSAADANKIVFSENPGNPSDQPANAQWYYAWLSVSFVYVPAPNYSDPITGIMSFQDKLTVFTYSSKYDIYGTDRGSLTLRQSMGKKGAVAQNAIFSDENFIYFVAIDGFYRFNGSSDELISDRIQAEFDGITSIEKITIAKWRRQIRFYYPANGSSFNTDCLLYHTVFEEWQHDTEVYAKRGLFWADGDDDRRLVESSSLTTVIYNAEQAYHSLGKAIDFAYWTRYDSLGGPAQKKRLLKYFPLIQGVGRSFIINVDMDKDFANNPVQNKIVLTTNGAIWGDFQWGDGTTWGGDTSFRPTKLRYPGYAYYWQMRVSKKAVDNPVMFFGVQYSYKSKRL